MASTVTIDKVYFETLLRRAEFHVSGNDHAFLTPAHLATVTIPKSDHDTLLRRVHEYDRLREALFRGGITAQTLEVLVAEHSDAISAANNTTSLTDTTSRVDSEYYWNGSSAAQSESTVTGHNHHGIRHRPRPTRAAHIRPDANQTESVGSLSLRPEETKSQSSNGYGPPPSTIMAAPALESRRTLTLSNLPERTTHKDIVDVVRGGTLLDIFLRSNDRSANVSFVEGDHARAFMNHAKRNDIYIHGRRIDIGWNDRNFKLLGHIANKVSKNGASRNIVIRNVHDSITEEKLRNHLEHIHNLVVVEITFSNHCAWISLNSVHNALFARTCMMSRGSYRGMKIDWYPDECAQPLPVARTGSRKENIPPPSKPIMPVTNRFDLLNLDGGEEDSEDDGQLDLLSTAPSYQWAETSIAV